MSDLDPELVFASRDPVDHLLELIDRAAAEPGVLPAGRRRRADRQLARRKIARGLEGDDASGC